jgi:two-component system nitrate/nitrite response regulator NarL
MIDTFIAAEVAIFREALAGALDANQEIRVVATAPHYHQLEIDETRYRSAMLLVDRPNLGQATTMSILHGVPVPRIVVLGVGENEAEIVACAESGATGYVTATASIADLVATIVSVVHDELLCPPRIAGALIRRVGTLAAERRGAMLGGRLTRRELEILGLVTKGLSNREIARLLSIAVATVKNHVHNILDKLEVSTRAEASAWAAPAPGCPAGD